MITCVTSALLLSITSFGTKNASAILDNQIVEVIPSDAYVNQQVLVQAEIKVKDC